MWFTFITFFLCSFHLYSLFMRPFLCSSCFFFFKQKTAYELRISDWSSDVCSSDLIDRPALPVANRLGPDARQRSHHRAAGGDPPDAVRHLSVHDQIGRASCRERVCQYV